ncbi:phospholipid methyltransferase [Paenibacillus lutimineralis]|uniref:Phospholipid methyltransferase n=1 Tax=Paenibacillus lutimineralis TaxID=2707005 RepID=A0A3Q9I9L6_9BACL|nr:phospholipid methyltransferase [Paenibacillus lutimineralis]AZS15844.1 phospholipid methyltransferase [Paenibacillus lutimineralis]
MISSVGELIQEKALFFYKFLRSPGQIGSVTPSSKFLARAMVEPVSWDEVNSVAELGAGTGAITKYIRTVVKADTRVLLFEKDPVLYRELRFQYAQYGCYRDACRLQYVMNQEKIEQLDCVISGLPFFNFPQTTRDHLLDEIIASLKDGGLFIAFQYSRQMKKQLAGRFDIEEIKFVPLNVPPAFVYVCRKRGGQ